MHWKAPLASLCLLAGAALAGVMTDFLSDSATRQALDAILARAGGLKAERIVSDSSDGGLRFIGLGWQNGGVAIHVGALKLSSESPIAFPVAQARAEANTASAEDMTIETPFATYKIKRIDLAGASLSTAEFAQLLDAKSPAPIAQRLKKFSAAAVTIPELVVELKFGPVVEKIVYHDISLTGVVEGKVAAASSEGASFSISDPDAGGAEGAYGQMSAKNIDLVLFARLMAGSRESSNEPKTALYDSLAVDGIYLSNAKARIELNIKNLAGRGIRARPLRGLWFNAKDSDQPPLEAQKRAALLVADILDAFEIDELEATDVKLVAPGAEKPVGLSIAHVEMARFSGARIGAITVQNLELASDTAKIAITDFALRGLDLENLRDASAKVAQNDSDAAPGSRAWAAFPWVENLVLNKLSADQANPGISFKADHFELNGSSHLDGMPAHMDVGLDHLSIGIGQTVGGVFTDLNAMGYSQLDLSSRIEIAFDEARRELAIGSLSLEGAGMGAVKISGLFSNITKELLSPNRVVAAAAALGALLKKIDLRVENAGLFEKAIALQAKNQNKSADEVRQTYVTDAAVLLPALLENGPAARSIGAALAKFVAKPQSFHFIAVAPDGLGAADLTLMQTPGALLKKLEIEASANQ